MSTLAEQYQTAAEQPGHRLLWHAGEDADGQSLGTSATMAAVVSQVGAGILGLRQEERTLLGSPTLDAGELSDNPAMSDYSSRYASRIGMPYKHFIKDGPGKDDPTTEWFADLPYTPLLAPSGNNDNEIRLRSPTTERWQLIHLRTLTLQAAGVRVVDLITHNDRAHENRRGFRGWQEYNAHDNSYLPHTSLASYFAVPLADSHIISIQPAVEGGQANDIQFTLLLGRGSNLPGGSFAVLMDSLRGGMGYFCDMPSAGVYFDFDDGRRMHITSRKRTSRTGMRPKPARLALQVWPDANTLRLASVNGLTRYYDKKTNSEPIWRPQHCNIRGPATLMELDTTITWEGISG
jgi:hypothetical protein